jgi:hypothetical protein
MIRSLSRRKPRWRAFIIQVALLSLLSLHGLGLLHKHTAAADQDACVACQLINQQAALDLPDAGSGLLAPALLLLFLVVPWHRGVVAGAGLFTRPRSRAPPSFFRFS